MERQEDIPGDGLTDLPDEKLQKQWRRRGIRFLIVYAGIIVATLVLVFIHCCQKPNTQKERKVSHTMKIKVIATGRYCHDPILRSYTYYLCSVISDHGLCILGRHTEDS